MNVSLTRAQRETHQRTSLQVSTWQVSYYIAIAMYKHWKVQQICREVFEDTIKHACGIQSEPSNQYSAAMIMCYQNKRNEQRYEAIRIRIYAQVARPVGEVIERFSTFMSTKQGYSWKCVRSIYFALYVQARVFIERRVLDAASVISLLTENYLQPILNLVVPWIVSLDGGWEDLRQSSIWNSETHAIE